MIHKNCIYKNSDYQENNNVGELAQTLLSNESSRSLRKINSDDKIFASEAFLKDAVRYSLLIFIKDDAELYSNGTNILVARSNENTPIRIWTDEPLWNNEYQDVLAFLNNKMVFNKPVTIICKKELYNIIQPHFSHKFEETDFLEMESYSCPEPILKREKIWHLSKAKPEDKTIIAQFLSERDLELRNAQSTLEENLPEAESLVRNEKFYVRRDKQDTIVAMGKITRETEYLAAINTVFTDTHQRNKGYAGMLVYEMSNIILENKKLPVLYTDKDYPASNKSYKNVGYQESWSLIECTLSPREN